MVLELEWYGLYKEKWGKRITPSAVAHPAKIAYGLTVAIYDYMMAQGWLRPNDWVLDVFGGQAGTGFEALARGMNYVAVEIEPRFFEMSAEKYPCPGFDAEFWQAHHEDKDFIAGLRLERKMCPECEAAMRPRSKFDKKTKQPLPVVPPHREAHVYRGNLPYWQHKYGKVLPNWGEWIFVRGDSRFLRRVLAGQVDGSVISSPYGTRTVHGRAGIDPAKFAEAGKTGRGAEAFVMDRYGQEPGNLDGLPMGAAFVSTPYGASSVADPHVQLADASGIAQNEGDGQTYGKTDGQLANMPYDAALISSSYGGASEKHDRAGHERAVRRAEEQGWRQGLDSFKTSEAYGSSEGQIGAMPDGAAPDAAVLSSPYNLPMSQDHNGTRGGQRGTTPSEQGAFVKYGSADGQLEGLKPGLVLDAVFTSTPYADSVNQSAQANDAAARLERKAAAGVDVSQARNVGGPNSVLNRPQVYGNSGGQLGAMPAGDIDSVFTSTPYGVSTGHPSIGSVNKDDWGHTGKDIVKRRGLDASYGTEDGQLGDMPAGVDASVFSTPYFEARIDGRGDEGSSGLRMADGSYARGSEGWEARKAMGARYGEAGGNLGNMPPGDDPDTFWGATRMILAELYAVLKPGGVLASVTGDYIRDYKRVPFGRQWCAAAEAAGFVLVAHAKAWKVKEHPGAVDLFGEEMPGKKVQHLGMFRKMANAKNMAMNPDDPDAAIESEDVWFLQKPVEEGAQ